MKIQLNITATSKKITCEEEVDFKEVYDFLRKTFPDSWKEFKLCTKVIHNYSGYPWYWWHGGIYRHGATSYGTGTTLTSVGGAGTSGTITATTAYNANSDNLLNYNMGNLVVSEGSGTGIGDEPMFTLVKADADFSKDGVYNIEVLSDKTN